MITVGNNARIYIDGVKSNFYVHELVAPEIYTKWGIRAIRYVQEPLIRAVQFLRDKTGLPITVCSYKSGGTYRDSGTRCLESYIRMYGGKVKGLAKWLATYSMHRFAGALDLKIGKLTSFQMAKLIFKYSKELMAFGIRRIENPEKTQSKHGKLGRDWLHMDTALTGLDYIVKVNP